MALPRELDFVARCAGVVAQSDPELGALAREHRVRAEQLELGAEQVAVTVVHQHEAEAREQEREHESQAPAVVQRAEQHHEEHQREYGSEARGQDVDPTALEHDGVRVRTLPPARPGGGPVLEAASGREHPV